MSDTDGRSHRVHFSVFEVDLRAGELRKQGLKVKLQGQPFQILAMLLERLGEPVSREEIRRKLWPQDTFIDFEHSVNSSIKRLREALGDDAATPRFIETLPRHGYRFIAPVETLSHNHISKENGEAQASRSHLLTRWIAGAMVGLAFALMAILAGLNAFSQRDRLFLRIAPVPKIESIAVLPLENLSHDPEQEYFADGMTEELITDLGKIRALRVISRTSVMRFKGTEKPLPVIANELNVDALVEGTVLRSGNRIRVTVNLLHARTDRHLWAETYERDFRDVISLQDEVARAIAEEIKIKVTPQEQVGLLVSPAVSPEAYRLSLQARYHFYERTRFEKSIQLFQQALAHDPGYAPAYAGLAETYGLFPFYSVGSSKEAFPKAKAASLKAVEFDGSLAEGAPDLLQRVSRFPTASHLVLLTRRKPKAFSLGHKHHL
jgi:TolB-like protein/DNA-binding winged helix-turn-helix (wHTH) protein